MDSPLPIMENLHSQNVVSEFPLILKLIVYRIPLPIVETPKLNMKMMLAYYLNVLSLCSYHILELIGVFHFHTYHIYLRHFIKGSYSHPYMFFQLSILSQNIRILKV